MPISSFTARHRATTSAAAGAVVLLCGLGLSACSGPAASEGSGHSTSSEGASTGHAMLALDRAWAKSATSGMSAAFGTLTYHSADPVTLVSAESAAAESIEIHEMAMVDGAMVMRQIQGDFEIPAGGSRELSPGEHDMNGERGEAEHGSDAQKQ